MNSICSPYNPAKMTLSREMSSNDIMVDSRVNSEGGIVFYALEIVWDKLNSERMGSMTRLTRPGVRVCEAASGSVIKAVE